MIPHPDRALRQLPTYDVAASRREQIRGRALDVLNQRRTLHPLVFRASFAYHRFVEPAALVALGFSYLMLTVQNTLAVFQ
jgi:hypothetical protein